MGAAFLVRGGAFHSLGAEWEEEASHIGDCEFGTYSNPLFVDLKFRECTSETVSVRVFWEIRKLLPVGLGSFSNQRLIYSAPFSLISSLPLKDLSSILIHIVFVYTTENHVVLYTYKPINDRVTHNEILYEIEVRFSSFLL